MGLEEKSRYMSGWVLHKVQSRQRSWSGGQEYSLKLLLAICSLPILSYPKYS